jgi:hypothetical protein
MRKEVQETVRQFLAAELPREVAFYRLQRQAVEALVDAIEAQAGPLVTWEPPVDLLNFYHLQLPVLSGGRPRQRLSRRAARAQTTAILHILLSTYSCWAYCYWEQASTQEEADTPGMGIPDDVRAPARRELIGQVQQAFDDQGWQLLAPAEADEEVPAARPTWPQTTGPVLVRHLLFPGCAALLD